METTRSYTVRLAPTHDVDWRSAFVSTHWKINQGVKYFGEILLTFLAGLKPSLLEPFEDRIAERRSLLSLCWLAPESLVGSPAELRVDPKDTLSELRSVLVALGISSPQIESWVHDCAPTLTAAVRPDAVWVNRYKAWENLQSRWEITLGDTEIGDFAGRFISLDQLTQPGTKGNAKDSAKPMIQPVSTWVSQRFGEGKGRDYHSATEGHAMVADFLADEGKKWIGKSWGELLVSLSNFMFKETPPPDRMRVLIRLGHAGIKTGTIFFLRDVEFNAIVTKEQLERQIEKAKIDTETVRRKCSDKGPRVYSDKIQDDLEKLTGINVFKAIGSKRSQQKEFCVMLDHAARNLSCIVSWRRNAEAMRRDFDRDVSLLTILEQKHPQAKAFLDRFCTQRGRDFGTHGEYVISPKSIVGWSRVREAWKYATSKENRKEKAKRLLFEGGGDFGDIGLYLTLAEESAESIRTEENILANYVKGTIAARNRRRFKVPAFRHADPLTHPVFVDFGSSRPGVALDASGIVRLDLTADNGSLLHKVPLKWQSKRLRSDFGFDCDFEDKENSNLVPRLDRFGRSLATFPTVNASTERWTCRLQAPRFQLEQVAKRIGPLDPYQIDSWPVEAKRQLENIRWFLSMSPKMEYPGAWERYCMDHGGFAPESLPGYYRDVPIRFGSIGLLSGLPGLRLLSLRIGERAVSGVVWQVISDIEMKQACCDAGSELPAISVICCRVGNKSYRRISNNPNCCWARMERSFPIKLQGEDREIRMSTHREQDEAKQRFALCGRSLSPEKRKGLKKIDTLLLLSMETIKMALIRHAELVRCIHLATATETMISGGKIVPVIEEERKVESIQAALSIWSRLVNESGEWIPNEYLVRHWRHFILPLVSKKRSYGEIALVIVKDTHLHTNIVESLTATWGMEDNNLCEVIRSVKRMLFPKSDDKFRRSKESSGGFGGLSFSRIDLLQQWYHLLKSFSTRPTPDNAQGKFTGQYFAHKTFDFIARLKNERSKQLASRIVEAALGLSNSRDEGVVSHTPCHVVVIENMVDYKPEQDFSSKRIGRLIEQSLKLLRKRLVEHCQLYGLFLVEMIGDHITRQHAFSGEPAVRCIESLTKDLNDPLTRVGWWVEQLRQKQKTSALLSPYEAVVLDLADFWNSRHCSLKRKVLLPHPSGPILVSRTGKITSSDINAAANLGLLLLTDPEWPGTYWKLACDRKGRLSIKKKEKAPRILQDLKDHVLLDMATIPKTNNEVINVWRDVNAEGLGVTTWTYSNRYWQDIRECIYELLMQLGKAE